MVKVDNFLFKELYSIGRLILMSNLWKDSLVTGYLVTPIWLLHFAVSMYYYPLLVEGPLTLKWMKINSPIFKDFFNVFQCFSCLIIKYYIQFENIACILIWLLHFYWWLHSQFPFTILYQLIIDYNKVNSNIQPLKG